MTDPYQPPSGYGPQFGAPGTGSGAPYGQPGYGPPSAPYSGPPSGPYPHPPSDPYGHLPADPYAQPPGFALAIGDIGITDRTVVTPSGTFTLRGAIWTVTDMSQSSERIPPWAIVMAILFFPFCFLGLLFLLVKERTLTGFVQVTVAADGRFHSTMVPVVNENTFMMVMQQVNHARSLSA
ncbi:hypothetical protein NONO_c24530 [Nocardia nova SH22a]|uniref:Uncharacterized protein n=1 Tax=Nocardia nova SH22a TaxID=1415166 RepID=W5TDJ7_9NOCA|nr:hypothetical protein [Nocardia nova]AHH17249.1 hypothetical protein NONO_c24530 [Nocardia nova SH22a]